MKAQAFFWLHVVPLAVAMGLAAILLAASLVLSISAKRRGTWLPRFFNALFGALLFVSPPFRAFSHSLPVGQMSWGRLNEAAARMLSEHAPIDGYTASWLPDFLIGALVFMLGRMLLDHLRR